MSLSHYLIVSLSHCLVRICCVFRLDGTILFQKKVEKCWRAMWRPTPPELFPNPKLPVPESPSTVDNSAESTRDSQRSVKGLTTGEKYRHPHYRGTSSNSQVGGRTKSATHQDEGPKNYINRLPGGTPKSSSTNLPVGYRPVKTPTQAGRVLFYKHRTLTQQISPLNIKNDTIALLPVL